MLVSTAAVFLFLVVAYERLTNATDAAGGLARRALAAVLLQVTFQVLPIFVRLSSEVVAVQALGASALLLVWLYVMANVIVFGAEVNWWHGRRARTRSPAGLSLVTVVTGGSRAAAARARWELPPLPVVAELGDGPRLAVGDEDRVVAEALARRAARSRRSLEDSGAAQLLPRPGASATSSQT